MTVAGKETSGSSSTFQVLERFYEAERRYMQAGGAKGGASFDDMAATLHPDVILHQSPDLPWGGEYVGHQGFKDWSIAMSDCFDYLDVKDPEFFEMADKIVIVCRLTTRSRLHGNEMSRPMAQVVTVKDGKISEFRPFYWNVPDYVRAATPSR
jgi:ketosteroid isomerase-like protein